MAPDSREFTINQRNIVPSLPIVGRHRDIRVFEALKKKKVHNMIDFILLSLRVKKIKNAI